MLLKDATSGPKEILNREIQLIQKEPEAEILHNWSYKILIQVSVEKDPDTQILYKWSYRILIEVVEKDPETEILHKWSYRNMQKVQNGPHTEILRQRSCTSAYYAILDTSGPKASWCRPHIEILHRWSYRILRKVVEKDPETEILRKCS